MREQVRELIQSLLDLHGTGLERILSVVYDSGIGGSAVIDELGRDQLVSGSCLLHGLHPLDLETRVRNAIEEVKPRLGLHGGSVELLGVSPEGRVQLKLQGNCHECPSSRLTLRFSIEEALYAAAPDLDRARRRRSPGRTAARCPATARLLLQNLLTARSRMATGKPQ